MYSKKQVLSLFMILTMVLSLFPTFTPIAYAEENEPTGTFDLETEDWDNEDTAHKATWENSTLTVQDGANIAITGTAERKFIVVKAGAKANITLDNVFLTATAGNKSALALTPNTNPNTDLTLTLVGENTLTGGAYCAGINVPENTKLTIDGSGKLTVTGGNSGAGIGGNASTTGGEDAEASGTIIINSGEIIAKGGINGAAGIGGGTGVGGSYSGASGGNTTIKGGKITAMGGPGGTGDLGGSGIGSGNTMNNDINGGIITIEGGSVTATGAGTGAGIGGGGPSGSGGNITIKGGIVTATGGTASTGSGSGGAGIGGAEYGKGGSLEINGDCIVFAKGNMNRMDMDETNKTKGILVHTSSTAFYGDSITIPQDETVTIPNGLYLTIHANKTLIIPNNTILATDTTNYIHNIGRIINNGSIINQASIINHGTIDNNATIEINKPFNNTNGTINNYGTIDIKSTEWEITGNKIIPFNEGDDGIHSIEYDKDPISLEELAKLFTLRSNATPTYTIEAESTGVGEIADGKLTVTKFGDFIIKLTTGENNNFAASPQEIEVTSKLTVYPINAAAPIINQQPQSANVFIGNTHTLAVTATAPDSGDLSYQWYRNNVNSNSGGTIIDGATGETYAAPIHALGTTYYYVIVTNTNILAKSKKEQTQVSNAVELTVKPDDVTSITVSPKTATVKKGETLVFSAAVLPQTAVQTVKWSVSGQKSANTKIDSSGKLTIAANETAKNLTVTAMATTDQTKAGTATITITTPPTPSTPSTPKPTPKPTLKQTPKLTTKQIPKSRTVKKGTRITLKAPKNTTLYYTTNGKKPTLKSKKINPNKNKKIKISKKTTIKVFG